jgi:hypothetical protein
VGFWSPYRIRRVYVHMFVFYIILYIFIHTHFDVCSHIYLYIGTYMHTSIP